jgi:hypothetical protein
MNPAFSMHRFVLGLQYPGALTGEVTTSQKGRAGRAIFEASPFPAYSLTGPRLPAWNGCLWGGFHRTHQDIEYRRHRGLYCVFPCTQARSGCSIDHSCPFTSHAQPSPQRDSSDRGARFAAGSRWGHSTFRLGIPTSAGMSLAT